jgi:CSLREA domain-containing protein
MDTDGLSHADADRAGHPTWPRAWQHRSLLLAISTLLAVMVLGAIPVPAEALTLVTVTSAGDEPNFNGTDDVCDISAGSGPCTLRAAIQSANHATDDVEIQFAIPFSDPHIRPADLVRVIEVGEVTNLDLPAISTVQLVTINGGSQGSGANNAPLILIIPSAIGAPPALNGLTIGGTVAIITGLAIGNFDSGILIANSNGTAVRASYLGLDPDGSSVVPNIVGIAVQNSRNTDIGGNTLSNRNVISGNSGDGILVETCGCTGQLTRIRGNYLGTNADGSGARGNHGSGIHIFRSLDVQVGGLMPADGNVISGNTLDGITIESEFSVGVTVYSNQIGTNAAGTAAIGNRQNGISLFPEPASFVGPLGTAIGRGSAGPGPGNVIAGSSAYGIYVLGADLTTIRGNLIGLLGDGATVAPNGDALLLTSAGIYVNDSEDTDIGGDHPADRNVISGNIGHGIYLESVCSCSGGFTDVRGNSIGLNAAGTAAVPNQGTGVYLFEPGFAISPSGVTIGGTLPGEGNVISGNIGDGVAIVGSGAGAVDVFGNRVGTNGAATAPIGNGGNGVSLLPVDPTDPSDLGPIETFVGLDVVGAGNLISGNSGHGIYTLRALEGPFSVTIIARNLIGVNVNNTGAIPNGLNGIALDDTAGVWVFENSIANNGGAGVANTPFFGSQFASTITSNSIVANRRLGIDLSTALTGGFGDGKTDNVPLGPTNYPVISSATTSLTGTVVGGTLNTPPSSPFRVELFASPSCDPSGAGEGRTFLGGVDVLTDGAGDGVFAATAPPLPPGQFITATSTNPDGQTSEFSACVAVTTAAIIVTPTNVLTTTEGGGTATFTVRLSTLPVADVSIALSSSQPNEATVAPGLLTFASANGTTAQTVTVTGLADAVADGNQVFTIVTASRRPRRRSTRPTPAWTVPTSPVRTRMRQRCRRSRSSRRR